MTCQWTQDESHVMIRFDHLLRFGNDECKEILWNDKRVKKALKLNNHNLYAQYIKKEVSSKVSDFN